MRRASKTRPGRVSANLLTLAVALVLSAVGLLALYAAPVAIYSCRRVEPEQVDCRIEQRILGLIAVKEQRIVNVRRASCSSETRSSTNSKGSTTSTTYSTIVLESASGQQVTAGETAHTLTSSRSICQQINTFVAEPLAPPLRVWQAQWLPLVVGGVFMLFGLLLFAAILIAAVQVITGYTHQFFGGSTQPV